MFILELHLRSFHIHSRMLGPTAARLLRLGAARPSETNIAAPVNFSRSLWLPSGCHKINSLIFSRKN
jgi:hypothetical protein